MNKFLPVIIGGVVLVGLVLYFAMNQPQYHNWVENFGEEGKDPYDMLVLYELLEHKFELKKFSDRLEKELPKEAEEAKGTTYLYIGQNPKFTEDEAWHLRRYVQAGGQAFIITDDIQDSLAELLIYPEDCGSSTTWTGKNPAAYKDKVYSSFNHPSINQNYYEFEYIYEHYSQSYYWNFIPSEAFCNSASRVYPMASLGTFVDKEEKVYNNFARLQIGDGYFYFHTNPIMFTNMFMVDSVGLEYAEYVFSHVKTKKVFWDRESLLPPKDSEDKKRTRPTIPAKSPLEYIFSQTSLRWSWYLAIVLGLIYVVFAAKRRQRKIPILETNRNTSLEFVETIGRLYFQKQDHKGIIQKQMHLFLGHIRQRYNLVTRDLDEKLITRIAVRSKVDQQIINDIFVEYFKLKSTLEKPYAKLSADTLNNFYLLIERFHSEVRKMQFTTDKEGKKIS